MQYEQVILFVVFCLAIYYLAMIVMDLQKAKAAKRAEAENNKEEDIDISDEAKQFCPVKITREVKPTRVDDAMRLEKMLEQIGKDSSEVSKGNKKADELPQVKIEETPEWTKKSEPQSQDKVHTQKVMDNPKPKVNTEKAADQSQEEAKTQVSDKEDQEPEKVESQQEEQTPIRPSLRKPVMTNGISAEKLVEDLNAGRDVIEKELGALIMSCDKARDEY